MHSDWWKFNESMTSGTRPPVRNIRRGEEGVRASDLRPSENQARASVLITLLSVCVFCPSVSKQMVTVEVFRHRELKWVEMLQNWDKWITKKFPKVRSI